MFIRIRSCNSRCINVMFGIYRNIYGEACNYNITCVYEKLLSFAAVFLSKSSISQAIHSASTSGSTGTCNTKVLRSIHPWGSAGLPACLARAQTSRPDINGPWSGGGGDGGAMNTTQFIYNLGYFCLQARLYDSTAKCFSSSGKCS